MEWKECKSQEDEEERREMLSSGRDMAATHTSTHSNYGLFEQDQYKIKPVNVPEWVWERLNKPHPSWGSISPWERCHFQLRMWLLIDGPCSGRWPCTYALTEFSGYEKEKENMNVSREKIMGALGEREGGLGFHTVVAKILFLGETYSHVYTPPKVPVTNQGTVPPKFTLRSQWIYWVTL